MRTPRRWELVVDSSNGGCSLTPFSMVLVESLARDAQFALCTECLEVLHCPYWGPRQSKGLHERGTGHRVAYVALEGRAVHV